MNPIFSAEMLIVGNASRKAASSGSTRWRDDMAETSVVFQEHG
jgi:hypothetical protein